MGNIIQLIHQLAAAISRLSDQRISRSSLNFKGCRSFSKFGDLRKSVDFHGLSKNSLFRNSMTVQEKKLLKPEKSELKV